MRVLLQVIIGLVVVCILASVVLNAYRYAKGQENIKHLEIYQNYQNLA